MKKLLILFIILFFCQAAHAGVLRAKKVSFDYNKVVKPQNTAVAIIQAEIDKQDYVAIKAKLLKKPVIIEIEP